MAQGTAAGWRRALADGRAAATLGLPYLLLATPEGRSIILFCGEGVAVYPTQETKLSTAGREAVLWASGALERQLVAAELPLLDEPLDGQRWAS